MKHLAVGQTEAVAVLVSKNLDRLDQIDNSRTSRRLRRAIDRAQTRYRQIRDPDGRGFYHGLITGYAVAMKVFQGKVGSARSA
ncbi:MAG TPA: hypothetical protein VGX97_00675 [bacterium]|nr:hypothetical protein [bacterium]